MCYCAIAVELAVIYIIYKYHTVNYIYINDKFLVMTLYIFVLNYFEIMLEIVNL